jgi:hypothetical protein
LLPELSIELSVELPDDSESSTKELLQEESKDPDSLEEADESHGVTVLVVGAGVVVAEGVVDSSPGHTPTTLN